MEFLWDIDGILWDIDGFSGISRDIHGTLTGYGWDIPSVN